ncbi:dihydrofolate synthase [Malassezia caprae]|uniref:Dihydrofolate synthase n=1 Tax=Malassezia caprae TaxID=1381934 RepID=A0AAF0E7W6_9BASI|nr:dihydrofolate synthase [Malassezia caprae]
MDLGLGRVQALLRRVGSPHTRFPIIHVAGTNGKGSTIAYLDSILTHLVGLRAARFNSPHLVTARDSVRVHGGEPIDEAIWNRAVDQTRLADARDVPICATPFELLTVQTLLAFTLLPPESQPEILLIEVGVGGRLDATNVFPRDNVLASVLCPIALDHEGLLGKGLRAITHQKAGILQPQGLCVVADQTPALPIPAPPAIPPPPAEILQVLQAQCEALKARVAYTRIPWADLRLTQAPSSMGARIQCSLLVQSAQAARSATQAPAAAIDVSVEATMARVSGAATAIQTLWAMAHDRTPYTDPWADLRARIRARLTPEASPRLCEALSQCRWEGRCEWHMLNDVPVLLDGAHNEASARALRHYVDLSLSRYPAVSVTWIMAFSQGKDVSSMLHVLLRPQDHVSQRVALVPFSTPVEGMPWVSPASPDTLAERVREDGIEAHAMKSLGAALAWAQRAPVASPHIIIVCGSLYLVSDFYRNGYSHRRLQ